MKPIFQSDAVASQVTVTYSKHCAASSGPSSSLIFLWAPGQRGYWSLRGVIE